MPKKVRPKKYHSPGLWTNTCCSHQRDGESTKDAANRRLMEEMGLCVNYASFVLSISLMALTCVSPKALENGIFGLTFFA